MAQKLKSNQEPAFLRRVRAASALAPVRAKQGDEREGDASQPGRKRKKSQSPRRAATR
jgi:hypothetical protein